MSNLPVFQSGDLVEIAPGNTNHYDNLEYVQRQFFERFGFVVTPQTRFMVTSSGGRSGLVRVVPVSTANCPILPRRDMLMPDFCTERFQHIPLTVHVTRRLTVLGK